MNAQEIATLNSLVDRIDSEEDFAGKANAFYSDVNHQEGIAKDFFRDRLRKYMSEKLACEVAIWLDDKHGWSDGRVIWNTNLAYPYILSNTRDPNEE